MTISTQQSNRIRWRYEGDGDGGGDAGGDGDNTKKYVASTENG
jgi:hypothetical protein